MRRGLALVRVSKIGDRGEDLISPELQRHAIEVYALSREISIVDWVEVLDESGSQKRSRWWRHLDAAIGRVETERLDCLLAWKFSRASRDRLRWAVALDRIEQAGATLESATEGVDTTTATGRFTRGMLAEIAAFEADRIGEGWREVKDRRRRMGLGDGQPRFGYLYLDGKYLLDLDLAEHLRFMFVQYAQGASLRSIAAALNHHGVRTRRGNLFTGEKVRDIIYSGFGAGLLRSGDEWVAGVQEAVVDGQVWSACQERFRKVEPRRSTKHTYSGLLVCAVCLKKLHATGYTGYPAGTRWICSGPTHFSGCTGTSAWAPSVDRVVDAWVADLVAGRDEEFRKAVGRKPRSVARQKKDLLKVEESLLSIARKNERNFYDDDTYLRLRGELLDERRLLQKQIDEAETPSVPELSALMFYQSLPHGPLRNEALSKLLRHVIVGVRVTPKYRPVGVWVD